MGSVDVGIYTCSLWRIREGEEMAFLEGFKQFTRAADALGEAREGWVLQGLDEPGLFLAVRRWNSAEAVERWSSSEEHQAAAKALGDHEASEAHIMTRVADLPA